MFWKRSKPEKEGAGAAGAAAAGTRWKKWRQRVLVAIPCAMLAALAGRAVWRAVAYDPVDRRVEEWRTADPARRMAIEKELAGLRRPCHIRRLIWHTGDDAETYASGVPRMAWETLKGMGERVIEPARREVAAWKPLAHGESVFIIDSALQFLPGYLDDIARMRLGQHRLRTSRVDRCSISLLMGAGPSAKPALRRLADSKRRGTRTTFLHGLSTARSTSVHEFRLELAERRGADAQPLFAQVLGMFVRQTGLRLPPLDEAAFDRCAEALDATQPGTSVSEPAARAAWPPNNALVLKALGAVDNPEAAEVLARFLADGGTPRSDAAVMLALHDDPRALPALMEEFAEDCLESLARVADAEAVAEMAKAAEKRKPGISWAAEKALRQVTQQDLRPAEIRRQAREALDRLGTNEDARQSTVVEALKKVQPQGDLYETALERASAVYELGDYAGDEVTDALVAALADTHPWVRRAAARSLGRIAGRGSITEVARAKVREGLEKAGRDADASVRDATSEALTSLPQRRDMRMGGQR